MQILAESTYGPAHAGPGSLASQVRDLRKAEFALRGSLNPLERDWLVARLLEKRGIETACYRPRDPRRLVVEYDADAANPRGLRDFLGFCGVPVRAVQLLDRLGT